MSGDSGWSRRLLLTASAGATAGLAGYLTWRHIMSRTEHTASGDLIPSHLNANKPVDAELSRAVAAEEQFMAADEEEGFDLEVEEQQCNNLKELLQRLCSVPPPMKAQLEELEQVLHHYSTRMKDSSWRSKRKDSLQMASDAICELLSADGTRDLAAELRVGSTVPAEVAGALAQLTSVLSNVGSGSGGGGCCGGGCGGGGCGTAVPQKTQGSGSCAGGGCGSAGGSCSSGGCGKAAVQNSQGSGSCGSGSGCGSGGGCGGGGCGGGGCGTKKQTIGLPEMVAQCKTPQERKALADWIVDEEIKRLLAENTFLVAIPQERKQEIRKSVEAAIDAAEPPEADSGATGACAEGGCGSCPNQGSCPSKQSDAEPPRLVPRSDGIVKLDT